MTRGISFNAETGAKESSQQLWEGSSYEKMAMSRGRVMDRANSFVAHRSVGEDVATVKEHEEVIVVVDPFSTGAHLAAAVVKAGYRCARVLSIWDSPVASLVQEGITAEYCATIQHNDQLADQERALNETVNSLRALPFEVIAVIPGAETGVELADQLATRLKLRTNGIEKSFARRNKYAMGEAVRSAGIRAVKQATCVTEAEVLTFLDTLRIPGSDALHCVLKPVQSAGTDDVFLCQNEEEALTAFHRIYGKLNGIGLRNDCVLVQEYLVGKEYVVDKVSRDGVHKLVAIWEYDKRKVNGANFVYFGMRLKPSDTKMAEIMVAYGDKVLDAVGIQHGPSHMEIMLNTIQGPDGPEYHPCLVEVGARCHGGEGTWLSVAEECVGYTMVGVTLDVYLKGELFNKIDSKRFPLKKAGREVDMVSRFGGIVRSLPGDEAIRKLPSFRGINWEVKPGDYISKTIDCFTRPGCVELVADTEEDAERDLEAIHALEIIGLIDYAVICPKPPSIGAVVVVDPFSTGANLAATVLKWGYKLILIFSERDSPVAKLVAKSAHFKPTLMIQHDNTNSNQEAALQQTLAALEQEGSPILTILPGSEPGVELADRLAARYGTRHNLEDLSDARRNKFLMQEAVKRAGLRSVDQRHCHSEHDVRDFVAHLAAKHLGIKCVVKPNQSMGTDSVFLCHSVEEALNAFNAIHGQINGLGRVNDGALCQEYLPGTEFVVDGVSRDGVYKVVAVWEYDKRSANGAPFVYFGMKLRDGNDPEIDPLIRYAKHVARALQVDQGPSHIEIIMDSTVENGHKHYHPCLVELGARCHGGEGTWMNITNECIGYNQVEVALSCYLRPDRFEAIPAQPTLLQQGCEAFLVSYKSGIVRNIPGIDDLRELPSFRRLEMVTQPGSTVKPTVDSFSRYVHIMIAFVLPF